MTRQEEQDLPPRDSRDDPPSAQAEVDGEQRAPFTVRVDGFEGPFDLLLQLVAKHQLDLTELALAAVTEEFLAHTRALGAAADLGETTQFLVVAATLLDLKVARLLPGEPSEDPEDLALLEARDLLFARLLQYRAYRAVAAELGDRLAQEGRRHPRAAPLEPRFAALLPELLLGIGPDQLAALAARALTPRPVPTVAVDHVHAPVVPTAGQVLLLRERLAAAPETTFRALVADCPDVLHVVARFLALLELHRGGEVAVEQPAPLGEIVVRWTRATCPTPAAAGSERP